MRQQVRSCQRFLRVCAGRAGQRLDLSGMGNDLGVNYKTVSAWISVLEASYIAFLLYPHHENFAKRLIKSPKLYFPWYRQFTPPAPGKMGSGEQRPGR